jgi:hypothetical protein
MDAMNTFDRTPQAQPEYRPILRADKSNGPDPQETECCCPDLCQVDHGN